MFSRRFVKGSSELEAIRHEIWDANNLGNAIPGATPRAEIAVGGTLPGLPLITRRGRQTTIHARVKNASSRPFPAQASYGRRLVRLGAQLCSADGAVINRDYERAWLPGNLPGGSATRHSDDDHRARDAGTLRVEVRSGRGRNRLVRGLRLAYDDEDSLRSVKDLQLQTPNFKLPLCI